MVDSSKDITGLQVLLPAATSGSLSGTCGSMSTAAAMGVISDTEVIPGQGTLAVTLEAPVPSPVLHQSIHGH